MNENTRMDIRRLLKKFGVQADEAIISHLAKYPDIKLLKFRIVLEDLTDYGHDFDGSPLGLSVAGDVSVEDF